jgi:hypothetical protein
MSLTNIYHKKPITAITVLIERLTKEEYEVDDLSDIDTLIEAIRIQRQSGATEAARAIRKKLYAIQDNRPTVVGAPDVLQ